MANSPSPRAASIFRWKAFNGEIGGFVNRSKQRERRLRFVLEVDVGRDHEIILTFPTAVTVDAASVTSSNNTDGSNATFSVASNVVMVDLHSYRQRPAPTHY